MTVFNIGEIYELHDWRLNQFTKIGTQVYCLIFLCCKVMIPGPQSNTECPVAYYKLRQIPTGLALIIIKTSETVDRKVSNSFDTGKVTCNLTSCEKCITRL